MLDGIGIIQLSQWITLVYYGVARGGKRKKKEEKFQNKINDLTKDFVRFYIDSVNHVPAAEAAVNSSKLSRGSVRVSCI